MKKTMKIYILLLVTVFVSIGTLPAAARLGNNEHHSVEEQIPADEANATPLKDADGQEIAFQVSEAGTGNSTAGIVMMVAVFGVCLFLCGEGIYSYVKKSRKRREEMFQKIDRE